VQEPFTETITAIPQHTFQW